MDGKTIQFGNEGEELVPGKTENLSSTLHGEGDAARPEGHVGKPAGGDGDADQRGEPARFDRRSGDVSGSGSNAGGGGTPGEDYDQDTAGGGTKADPQMPPL